MAQRLTIALVGNPNCGKTTVFNNITGARQHVGNYPGVTVEKKEGTSKYKDYDITVVDLPGTYSLTAYSIDEIIARNFIIEDNPDVIIDVIDSSNLERNLYLATQLIELGGPLVLVFNMYDIAQKRGFEIDIKKLSDLLGCPIVSAVATKKQGMAELLEQAIHAAEGKSPLQQATIGYGKEIQEELEKLQDILSHDPALVKKYPSGWLAIKLLENDGEVITRIQTSPQRDTILSQTEKSIHHLETIFGDSPEAVIADRRYGFISGACSESVKKSYEVRHSRSDEIDKVMVNKILGFPIFLALMWLVFKFTFTLGEPLMNGVEVVQQWLGNMVGGFLPAGSAVQSLVVDGIIAGVGSVLVFVPIIFLMFLAIALLEDSGYMARAAFIMDRLMHKIGLHGRSFIPLLLGIGCNAAAIMATRTIEDRKDRLVTILINPFISCGARIPVYTLLAGAFFSERMAGNVLFSIYLLGMLVAMVMARLLRRYLFKGEATPFVMELPPYRIPTFRGLIIHMWERGVVYLRKAGTIIFAGCIFVWFLSNFPWNPPYSKDYATRIEQASGDEDLVLQLKRERAAEKAEKSFAGMVGKTVVPVFKPLGLDDWRIGVGLLGGLIGKEIMVGTLGTLYAAGEADEPSGSLREALQNTTRPDGSKQYNPLVAYTLMVFVLLYMPCLAVIAVIKKETNSWKWPLFAAVYTTVVAWIVAFIVYQGGMLLGLGQ